MKRSENVSRTSLVSNSVRLKRCGSVSHVGVIEHLREQIRCIEGRIPVLDSDVCVSGGRLLPQPAPKPEAFSITPHGWSANGSPDDDKRHNHDNRVDHRPNRDAPNTLLTLVPSTQQRDQAGSPADRFVNEDGGAAPHPAPPSSTIGLTFNRTSAPPHTAWKLGGDENQGECRDITQLVLDTAGVHEVKPALSLPNYSETQDVHDRRGIDWAASWSATRRFCLALIARRLAGRDTDGANATVGEHIRRPVLWCLPRPARAEHGTPYIHGLQQCGLMPTDVLFAETGTVQDTLWTIEEGLKSDSLALVISVIDDVELTPARRLALAAQKHRTPCLLITHPRMPPVGATATRWCVSARTSGAHALSYELGPPLLSMPKGQPNASIPTNIPGPRRMALTLERCRAAPSDIARFVTGREFIVEWSDETLCFNLAPDLCDRSHAPRAIIGTQTRDQVAGMG